MIKGNVLCMYGTLGKKMNFVLQSASTASSLLLYILYHVSFYTIILMIVFKHIKGSLCCFFCSKGKEGLFGQCLPRLYLEIFIK